VTGLGIGLGTTAARWGRISGILESGSVSLSQNRYIPLCGCTFTSKLFSDTVHHGQALIKPVLWPLELGNYSVLLSF